VILKGFGFKSFTTLAYSSDIVVALG
jgi:hypothetical protein